jgi:hypothetical protein
LLKKCFPVSIIMIATVSLVIGLLWLNYSAQFCNGNALPNQERFIEEITKRTRKPHAPVCPYRGMPCKSRRQCKNRRACDCYDYEPGRAGTCGDIAPPIPPINDNNNGDDYYHDEANINIHIN